LAITSEQFGLLTGIFFVGYFLFEIPGVRYTGSTDDTALNRGVARFTADPAATAAIKADGDLTGVLPVPGGKRRAGANLDDNCARTGLDKIRDRLK
jgi:hypothetical protein